MRCTLLNLYLFTTQATSAGVELTRGVLQKMISMVLTEANMFQETPGTHSSSENSVRKKFPVRKSPSSSSLGQKKSC